MSDNVSEHFLILYILCGIFMGYVLCLMSCFVLFYLDISVDFHILVTDPIIESILV